MIYKPTRQESEDVIRMLADRYPKCFFEDPKMRRPLKHNILADLQKDGVPLAREAAEAAINWYQSNFSYLYSLQAGAKRIDLNGTEVSTVTEREHLAALAEIKAIKATQLQRRSSTETVSTLYVAGRLSDDDVKKLDAPMIPKTTKTIASELTKLYEAVMAANTTLGGPGDHDLRSAIAAAALGCVCEEAQRLIDSLKNHHPEESAAKGTLR